MKDYFVFVEPYQKNTLWAGQNLQNQLKSSQKIGELWLISAQKHGLSRVGGQNLDEFFAQNRQFFSFYPHKTYPNLHKIIDAGQKLSLQVHPDNKLAKKLNSFGKDEAWLVLNKGDDPFIIGAKSNDFAEKITEINNENIDKHCNFCDLEKNDFAYISAGLIHSIPQGALVYEIQQNSDLTFRIFDFDRLDTNGQKRELHFELAKVAINPKLSPKIIHDNKKSQQSLVKNNFFNLEKVKINQKFLLFPQNDVFWYEIIIISGHGKINDAPFKPFDAILISGQIEKPIEFQAENALILINKII
ncbi:type I phosphomannose isomerase catalytic subunit [Mesomycoplasma ovipneumoniae]|uniref:type I phosphomannose isomerase catalytic subunit n=1 Tax=Mesomycoplasma ovipneumoniae TaxID=29562 RepID=UPI00216236BA|nr:type I phosphomannose isomerase catalytic subunit [Mesomycoplasma ovipneumoniae]MDW2925075.1 type I phosphomannose isomerase catalytic subunit [Mesomycoplasma ovipneumoniae]UVO15851.1 class I mannose-6-phosphate isomerase [Mesomycoplasma ovipneumoniae]